MRVIESRRRRRRSHRLGLVTPAAAAAALALCSCGDGAPSAAVQVPEDCLQSWNSESASRTFGRHVYESHGSKQGQVVVLQASGRAINIAGKRTCAVVFVVPESDPEYGAVGLVITKFGWASLQELARGDAGRLERIQADASAAPNVNLFPDGTLDPI